MDDDNLAIARRMVSADGALGQWLKRQREGLCASWGVSRRNASSPTMLSIGSAPMLKCDELRSRRAASAVRGETDGLP
jgi:hypothetical protein